MLKKEISLTPFEACQNLASIYDHYRIDLPSDIYQELTRFKLYEDRGASDNTFYFSGHNLTQLFTDTLAPYLPQQYLEEDYSYIKLKNSKYSLFAKRFMFIQCDEQNKDAKDLNALKFNTPPLSSLPLSTSPSALSLRTLGALYYFASDERFKKDSSIGLLQHQLTRGIFYRFNVTQMYSYYVKRSSPNPTSNPSGFTSNTDLAPDLTHHKSTPSIYQETMDYFTAEQTPKRMKLSLFNHYVYQLTHSSVHRPVPQEDMEIFSGLIERLPQNNLFADDFLYINSDHLSSNHPNGGQKNVGYNFEALFDCENAQTKKNPFSILEEFITYHLTTTEGSDRIKKYYAQHCNIERNRPAWLETVDRNLRNKKNIVKRTLAFGALVGLVAPVFALIVTHDRVQKNLVSKREQFFLQHSGIGNNLEKSLTYCLLPHFSRLPEWLQKRVQKNALELSQSPLFAHVKNTRNIPLLPHIEPLIEQALLLESLPDHSNSDSFTTIMENHTHPTINESEANDLIDENNAEQAKRASPTKRRVNKI